MQVMTEDRLAFARRFRTRLATIAVGLLVATLALAVILALVIPPLVGVVVALAVGAGAAVVGVRTFVVRVPAQVLANLGGRPADPREHARLFNVVEGLCVTHGVGQPTLVVLDDAGLNACAIGVEPRATTLVVTSGACDSLTRIELEAVVARQLVAVKAGEVARLTRLVATAGVPAAMVEAGAPAVLAGSARAALGSLRDEHLVAHADLAGVAATRYPPGLAAALERMTSLGAHVSRATRADAHLWTLDPLSPANDDEAELDIFPSPASRIAALHEL